MKRIFKLSSTRKLLVRDYRPADYSRARTVLKQTKLFDPSWDSRKSLSLMARHNSATVLVGEADGKVIACIYLFAAGHWAMIFRLAVAKRFQKLGIGTHMLECIEQILRRRKIPEVSLFFRLDNQHRWLRRFYEKRGWTAARFHHQIIWKWVSRK